MTKFDRLDDPREYKTPDKAIAAGVLLLTVILAEALFPGFLGWFYTQTSTDIVGWAFASLDEVLLVVGLVTVHEGIHYAVASWQGYSPEAGVKFFQTPWRIPEPSPYIVVLDEPITRRDNIAMLLAPLVMINAVALVGLLPVFPAIVGHYAGVVLVVNTGSSLSDVYIAARIALMEPGTKFVNVDDGEVQTFYQGANSE